MSKLTSIYIKRNKTNCVFVSGEVVAEWPACWHSIQEDAGPAQHNKQASNILAIAKWVEKGKVRRKTDAA